MKNKFLFTLALLILLFSILACSFIGIGDGDRDKTITGSGPLVKQNRDVSGITRVELAIPGTLHITMGNTTSLQVEAQDNLMEYLKTDVQGNTLLIHTPPGTEIRSTRPIQYYLTVEKLDEMVTSSSGDIEAGNLTSDSLSITINSSGKVSIDSLDGSSLDVKISSSGDIKVSGGQVQEQKVRITSSGDYQAGDLASSAADIDLTSNGSATVQVRDRLSGRLSSSGNLYYIGSPEVYVSVTSSGKAVQVD